MQVHTHASPFDHSGFTLIELLVVMCIISILCGIGLANYGVYRKQALFASAEMTMHNARIALEAGQDYLENVQSVNFTARTDDGDLTDDQKRALPGLVVKPGIRVQLWSMNCHMGSHRMEMITVYSCESGYYTWWMRTCQGMESSWGKSAIPRGMCS